MKPPPYRAPWIYIVTGAICMVPACLMEPAGSNIQEKDVLVLAAVAGLLMIAVGTTWIALRRFIYWLRSDNGPPSP